MLLIDYSQLIIRSVFADRDMMMAAKEDTATNRGILKHMALNNLRSLVVKYAPKYGRPVIAVEGGKTWRKELFGYYKAHRAKARSKDVVSWEMVKSVSDELCEDLKKHFPYPVIKVPMAEADDVIGWIVMNPDKTASGSDGGTLFAEEADTLIISSDGDFVQLQKHKGVKQWNPTTKKFVTPEVNPEVDLIAKIVRGDAGDGIPNIRSVDNAIVDGIRQKPISQKMVDDVVANGTKNLTSEEARNYDRNRILISFESIPKNVASDIESGYNSALSNVVRSKSGVMNYFIQNRMKTLHGQVADFFVA